MTTEKIFHVRIKDEEIQNILNSKESINGFLLKLITDYINGDLVASNETSLDLEIKKTKLRKLNAETRIKEFEANQLEIYKETFHIPPSKNAQKAIEKGAVQRENTNEEIANVITHFEFIEKIPSINKMQFFCKHCANKFEITESEMIGEMTRHTIALHSNEILKNERS